MSVALAQFWYNTEWLDRKDFKKYAGVSANEYMPPNNTYLTSDLGDES